MSEAREPISRAGVLDEQAGRLPVAEAMRRSIPAMAEMGRVIAPIMKLFVAQVESIHRQFAPLTSADGYRRHRRRCRICNPAGNPRPLTVNGAEYHRRRSRRRRRG